MIEKELNNGAEVIHTKYGRHYIIRETNMRLKDSAKGWIDAIVYSPLYENEYDCFCREKTSFLEEFELSKTE